MKIEFILEPHETKAETSALIVAAAIRKALSEEVYKKVIFICYADIVSDELGQRL